MAMPDLQRYPWNLNMIKNVRVTVFVQTQKVLNSDIFSIAS